MYAVITGASTGLGKEFAYFLADKGYDLVLVARRENLLLDIKEELNNNKINVVCLKLDLSIYNNCIKLFDRISQYDIELFINNAGAGYLGRFFETDLDRQNKIVDLNIKSLQNLTMLFIDRFKKGKILNIGSLAGCLPTPNHAVYSATKSFVNNFSRAVNYELKRSDKSIRIYTALPGPVKTEFSTNAEAKINRGMNAKKCAKLILDGVDKNKEKIIPGFKFKLIYFLTRIIPKRLLMKIAYKIQMKK